TLMLYEMSWLLRLGFATAASGFRHSMLRLTCPPVGASQFLAAFGQSDAETHEKRGTAEPRFASRLATILPLPEGEGRGEGAFDVSLTYQKTEMLPQPVHAPFHTCTR